MDQHTLTLVAIIAVIAAIAILGYFYWRQRHTQRLRARFGPEYDRVLRQEGSQRRAEGVLDFRATRREKLNIRELAPAQRSAFMTRWTEAQARFVDDPPGAVSDADQLINEVMSARGYPMTDFEQRAADISVDHSQVVENYRAARDIAARHSRGQANTEDLRRAFVHYRWLFQDLLGEDLREQGALGESQPSRKEKLA